jgi:hypothetical protein
MLAEESCDFSGRGAPREHTADDLPFGLVSLSSGFTFSLSSNARASTVEQVAGFEAQVRELQSIGAKKIFREQIPLSRPVRNLKAQSIFAAKATC